MNPYLPSRPQFSLQVHSHRDNSEDPDRETLTVEIDGLKIELYHVTDIHVFLTGCAWIQEFPQMYLDDPMGAFEALHKRRGAYWRERLGPITEVKPKATAKPETVSVDISIDDILSAMGKI